MQYYVFSPDFELLGIIDTYQSSSWMEHYQERGSFSMVADDISENIRLLKEGNLLWQHGKQTSMLLRNVEMDSETNQISAHGYTALELLNQRIIYPKLSVYNVEAGMKDIVLNNLRGLPRISVAESKGLTEIFDTQFTGHELLEPLNTLAVESGLGFYMGFDPENVRHVFTPYKGRDLTQGENLVLFKEDFGNLSNMKIVDDNTVFKNVAYVAGAGEGEARKWIIVGNAEGRDRYELFVDARDIQPEEGDEDEGIPGETVDSPSYIQRLTNRGIEKLNERIRVQTFVASVDPANFGVDYYLGDIVICSSAKYGVTLNSRILQYEETTERNETTLKITFGEPELTIIDELRLKL